MYCQFVNKLKKKKKLFSIINFINSNKWNYAIVYPFHYGICVDKQVMKKNSLDE